MNHLRYAGAPHARQREVLETIVRSDAQLMRILNVMRALDLPDCWLVAGAVYQTVWNALSGRPAGYGIRDYDIAYCDCSDLSWAGEDRIISSLRKALGDCGLNVEVRNQARVHLWFAQRFGLEYEQVNSTAEAISRYASICHKVAVRLDVDDRLEIYCPDGLDDLFSFTLTPNRVLANEASHHAKAERCLALWPELVLCPGAHK